MLTNFLLLSIFMAGLALYAGRRFDHRADREAMNRLASVQQARPACFDPAMIADLPEPARLTVSHQGLSQSLDDTVAPDGQPIQVCFERWSNVNPERQHRLQPVGGHLSEFREFAGFRLPVHVEAGNGVGTDQYFPFFVVDVKEVECLHD